MTRDVQICPQSGKRAYPSKRLAMALSRRTGKALRAYFCAECLRWHVTSEPKRKPL